MGRNVLWTFSVDTRGPSLVKLQKWSHDGDLNPEMPGGHFLSTRGDRH
jgi:hypothetical protein